LWSECAFPDGNIVLIGQGKCTGNWNRFNDRATNFRDENRGEIGLRIMGSEGVLSSMPQGATMNQDSGREVATAFW